jgi:hypothetical protein
MDLKVELIPHIGQMKIDIGGASETVDVDTGQSFVQVNGKRLGVYCGRKNDPGRYLSFTEPLPLPLQEKIAAEVTKITGGVGKFSAPPPEEHEIANDSE